MFVPFCVGTMQRLKWCWRTTKIIWPMRSTKSKTGWKRFLVRWKTNRLFSAWSYTCETLFFSPLRREFFFSFRYLTTSRNFFSFLQKMEIKTEEDEVDEGVSPKEIAFATNPSAKWSSPRVRSKLKSSYSFSKCYTKWTGEFC